MSAPTASRPLAAAAWVAGTIAGFSAMTVAGRELAAGLDTFEVMFWRSVVGMPIILAAIILGGAWSGLRTRRAGLHIGRNTVHFVAQNLWFYAIGVIPLAQLTALEFTNPIWVAALAPLLLGETLTRAKVAAAALGFLGVLLIARPGAGPLDWGHLAALGSALGFALTNMATRGLARDDGTLCIVFWMTLSQLVFALLCGLPGGLATPDAAQLPWVVLVGLSGLAAHYCLTQALQRAPASVVGPMEFARLPVIAVVGMAMYAEPVQWLVAAGAALIIAGNLVNVFGARRSAA